MLISKGFLNVKLFLKIHLKQLITAHDEFEE